MLQFSLSPPFPSFRPHKHNPDLQLVQRTAVNSSNTTLCTPLILFDLLCLLACRIRKSSGSALLSTFDRKRIFRGAVPRLSV
jgi:hypothetical protein